MALTDSMGNPLIHPALSDDAPESLGLCSACGQTFVTAGRRDLCPNCADMGPLQVPCSSCATPIHLDDSGAAMWRRGGSPALECVTCRDRGEGDASEAPAALQRRYEATLLVRRIRGDNVEEVAGFTVTVETPRFAEAVAGLAVLLGQQWDLVAENAALVDADLKVARDAAGFAYDPDEPPEQVWKVEGEEGFFVRATDAIELGRGMHPVAWSDLRT